MRLFRDTLHLPAGLTVEIKPLGFDKQNQNEKPEYTVRYSTLTASIMLHEELKLCYLASDDDDFFPAPKHLSNHFVAAVVYTAYHFIHCLRPGYSGDNVMYESYVLRQYNLRFSMERQAFRQTINRIYIHQIQTIRDVKLARLQKVLTLDSETRKYRLDTRTHKYNSFSHELR